ncbi:DUF177 domain-containing protein [Patescibacteria group bacterium]
MKQFGLVFEAGDLVRDKQGTKYTFEIDEKVTFDLDYKALSNITGKVSFMKLEDGILAEASDIKLRAEFDCNKCNDKFSKKIQVENASRMYFFEKKQDIQDLMDIFYVDIENMKVDISDFIRQEIILHFPQIPVCSNSCKGLCPKCGTNLNHKNCNCKKDSNDQKDQEKPLAILKQLYNAKTCNAKEEDGKDNN